jgi:hypothetical protein
VSNGDASINTPEVVAGKSGRGFFGGKKALQEENDELRAALAAVGFQERDALKAEIAALTAEMEALRASSTAEREKIHADTMRERNDARAAAAMEKDELSRELRELKSQVVDVSDEAMLQEVGIYRYHHPLDTSMAYKSRMDTLKVRIKDMAKADGRAVTCATDWTVEGSRAKGQKMVRDFSKLMLRSYNTETDILVRAMKPHQLDKSVERLTKARAAVSRLGKSMGIEITDEFHRLRVEELQLMADYLAKVAEEKEKERAERERIREEEKARREYERETAKLQKERSHYESVLARLRENGDEAAVTEAEAKFAEIEEALRGLTERAANIRAGYVYVISNIGSFGERMVKIGMTRRLDPMDRVRELGDASVPFRYDVHALIFSEDAVGLEGDLHQHFHSGRVNAINERREFFYATPKEVGQALEALGVKALEFEATPEALEWRQSESVRNGVRA